MDHITVAALYHFSSITDIKDFQKNLKDICKKYQIKGTILVAKEGINGTVSGTADDIEALISYLQSQSGFEELDYKLSFAEDGHPFYHMKVRLKKEIVTMGVDGVNPNAEIGTYVSPQEWNDIISDPDVIVIDTRNDYEYEIGTFKNALNPNTTSFRQFPEYVEKNIDKNKHKKVAMFCTGGIRCEKASSYMVKEGFDTVYHLKGGILKYLEEIEEKNSLWNGECFVFDQRISVKHGLEIGSYDICHACRHALSENDMQNPLYVAGISCHHCHGKISETKMESLMERQKQIELAKTQGKQHLGS